MDNALHLPQLLVDNNVLLQHNRQDDLHNHHRMHMLADMPQQLHYSIPRVVAVVVALQHLVLVVVVNRYLPFVDEQQQQRRRACNRLDPHQELLLGYCKHIAHQNIRHDLLFLEDNFHIVIVENDSDVLLLFLAVVAGHVDDIEVHSDLVSLDYLLVRRRTAEPLLLVVFSGPEIRFASLLSIPQFLSNIFVSVCIPYQYIPSSPHHSRPSTFVQEHVIVPHWSVW
mmetsp:Transcript_28290/g.43190  ORF Transcript_28290/g.43190 Transcript_28290/m.43190 type:complete len:226 (-) Transcript_28290:417-1094(-)